MRTLALLLATSTVLAACSPSPEAQLVARAHAAVTARLRDPASARFDALAVDAKRWIACGRVAGRNGFGGYADPSPFIYRSGGVELMPAGDLAEWSHIHALAADKLAAGFMNDADAKEADAAMEAHCAFVAAWRRDCPSPLRQELADRASDCAAMAGMSKRWAEVEFAAVKQHYNIR